MGQPSWMQVTPSSVNADYVSKFINDHADLQQSFRDPSRASSAEHASALKQLSSLFGTAMGDDNLSPDERSGLATLMTNTNAAYYDAGLDNRVAELGLGGFDAQTYDTSDVRVDEPATSDVADTDKAPEAEVDVAAETETVEPAATTGTEPRRAADGRIIYDAAPSLESVRNGEGTIGLGQKGEELEQIQQRLFDGGHYAGQYGEGATAEEAVDGFYGDKTTAAVQAWQTEQGVEATGRLDATQLDALLNGTAIEPDKDAVDAADADSADAANDGWWTSPQDDGLEGFDVDGQLFEENSADIFAGTTEGTDIRNASGRVVASDATTTGIGAEYNATIAGVSANLGDAQGTGIEGSVGVEADAYIGAEVSTTDGTIAGKAGAYAGVDYVEEFSFGARYFGMGVRGSAGYGAGGTAEGHAGYEDGRLSVGGFAKGGLGVTGGAGGDLWIDFGQMKDDAVSAGNWISDTVSGWFSGVDLSRNN